MLTSASSMMQSEKLESLLCCFLHGAPHCHHKTTEGRPLVTKGAKSPWMRAFASAENKSRLRSWGGLFLLHTSWLAGVQARTPAVCVPANTILGSLLGDPEFRLYTQSDKKGFFFPLSKPLPGRWILIRRISGVESGKPSSELLMKLLQGILAAVPNVLKGCYW